MAQIIQTILVESSAGLVVTFCRMGLSYGIPLLIALCWGEETLGRFIYLEAIIFFLLPFGTLGLDQGLKKYVSVWNANQGEIEERPMFSASCVLAVMVSIFIWIVANLWPRAGLLVVPVANWEYAIFIGSIIPLALLRIYSGQRAGHLRPSAGSFYLEVLWRVIFCIFAICIYIGGLNSYALYISYPLAILIVVVITFLFTNVPFNIYTSWPPSKVLRNEFGKYSILLIGLVVIAPVMSKMDKIILGQFVDSAVLGRYYIVALLAGSVTLIQRAVNAIIGPLFSSFHVKGAYSGISTLYAASAKVSFFASMPVAMSIAIFAAPIATLIGVDSYLELEAVLWILLAAYCIASYLGPATAMAQMTGREFILVKVNVILAIVAIACLWFFTKNFGVIGVAIVSSVILVTQQGILLSGLKRPFKIQIYDADFLRGSAIFIVLSGIGVSLRNMNMIPRPVISMVVFLTIAYIAAACIGYSSKDPNVRKIVQIVHDKTA